MIQSQQRVLQCWWIYELIECWLAEEEMERWPYIGDFNWHFLLTFVVFAHVNHVAGLDGCLCKVVDEAVAGLEAWWGGQVGQYWSMYDTLAQRWRPQQVRLSSDMIMNDCDALMALQFVQSGLKASSMQTSSVVWLLKEKPTLTSLWWCWVNWVLLAASDRTERTSEANVFFMMSFILKKDQMLYAVPLSDFLPSSAALCDKRSQQRAVESRELSWVDRISSVSHIWAGMWGGFSLLAKCLNKIAQQNLKEEYDITQICEVKQNGPFNNNMWRISLFIITS